MHSVCKFYRTTANLIMKIILVWFLFGLVCAAWESAFFQADYFHGNSLSQYTQGSCYYVCKKDEKVCNTLAQMGCKLVEESTYLVEGYEKDSESVKIWAKNSVKKVPHFLVISEQGDVYDWSANKDISPKIDYGTMKWGAGSQLCAAYDPESRQIFFRGVTAEKLFTTYIGRNQPQTELTQKDIRRLTTHRTCVASPSGKSLITYVDPDPGKYRYYFM